MCHTELLTGDPRDPVTPAGPTAPGSPYGAEEACGMLMTDVSSQICW